MKYGPEWSAEVRIGLGDKPARRANEKADIAGLIDELTVELAGPSGFCADAHIEVKLEAPDVPDLTLIDLPAIVRTSTSDQGEEVIEQVNMLLRQFLVQERTVVLCVIPANVDVATVDILEHAKKVDKSGERTMGLLTKPGLVDPGTELFVTNIALALPDMRLELIKKLASLRGDLANLGAAPPEMPTLMRGELAKMVCECAESMCKVALRADYSLLSDESPPRVVLFERRARKAFAGAVRDSKPDFDGAQDRSHFIVIESNDNDRVVGSAYSDLLSECDKDQQTVGAMIAVQNGSGKVVFEVTKLEPHFRGDLAAKIEAGRGRELPGFMSIGVFTSLMKGYVVRWAAPTDVFRDDAVAAVVLDASDNFVKKLMGNFPSLAMRFGELIGEVLHEADHEASERLRTLLAEEIPPMTEHHYLLDKINEMRTARLAAKIDQISKYDQVSKTHVIAELKSSDGDARNESQELQDMIDMLDAYWEVASERHIDTVAAIVHSSLSSGKLIDKVEGILFSKLVFSGDDSEGLKRLFEHSEDQIRRRAALKERVAMLEKAKGRIDAHEGLRSRDINN